jgi:hypothetical protein
MYSSFPHSIEVNDLPLLRGLLLGMLLAGCVAAPSGPPSAVPYTGRGLPLSAADVVAIYVSTDVAPRDPQEFAIRGTAISSPASVAEGFMEGFRVLRPDTSVSAADDTLRQACFDKASTSVTSAGSVLVSPSLDREACRDAVARQGIRYIVSIGGLLETTWSAPGGGIAAFALWVTGEARYTFALDAVIVDTQSRAVVFQDCEKNAATATYMVMVFPLPLPFARVVNESAYWKDASWYAGYKAAACFVPPGEKE